MWGHSVSTSTLSTLKNSDDITPLVVSRPLYPEQALYRLPSYGTYVSLHGVYCCTSHALTRFHITRVEHYFLHLVEATWPHLSHRARVHLS
jgi:hypothetical protein